MLIGGAGRRPPALSIQGPLCTLTDIDSLDASLPNPKFAAEEGAREGKHSRPSVATKQLSAAHPKLLR
jgi:hypothetical protein